MPRSTWASSGSAKQIIDEIIPGEGLASQHSATGKSRFEFIPKLNLPTNGDAGVAASTTVEPNQSGFPLGAAQPCRPVLPLALSKLKQQQQHQQPQPQPQQAETAACGLRPSGSLRHVSSLDSLESCGSAHSLGCGGDLGFNSTRFSDTASMASFAMSAAEGPPDAVMASLPPVPACFRCPVSHQIMEDPVCLQDGRCCERANTARLGASGKEARPNDVLREAIRGYFELRAESERQQQEWQDYLAHREERASKKLLLRQRQVQGLRLALEKSRRKMHELKEKQHSKDSVGPSPSAGSPSPSPSPTETVFDTPATFYDEAGADDEPHFRSGPAPHREKLKGSQEEAAQRQRRRSTWSAGRFLRGVRG